jgi:hypothetical protein
MNSGAARGHPRRHRDRGALPTPNLAQPTSQRVDVRAGIDVQPSSTAVPVRWMTHTRCRARLRRAGIVPPLITERPSRAKRSSRSVDPRHSRRSRGGDVDHHARIQASSALVRISRGPPSAPGCSEHRVHVDPRREPYQVRMPRPASRETSSRRWRRRTGGCYPPAMARARAGPALRAELPTERRDSYTRRLHCECAGHDDHEAVRATSTDYITRSPARSRHSRLIRIGRYRRQSISYTRPRRRLPPRCEGRLSGRIG